MKSIRNIEMMNTQMSTVYNNNNIRWYGEELFNSD